jgi:hypothetical protein
LKLKLRYKVAEDVEEVAGEETVDVDTMAGGGDVAKEAKVAVRVAQTPVTIQLKNGVS